MIRAIALALILALAAPAARAQVLLRDAGMEHALRELAAPVIQATGLSPGRIRILVVRDSTLNAFVANGTTIVLHSGLILKLETAAQLQAVIAHEAAHIANGHLTNRATASSGSNAAMAFGAALAAAAALAGSGEAAGGILAGSSSAARGALLAHTRAEESSADQTALRSMAASGIDPRAMAEVLDLFRGQEALSVSRQAAYARTHPLTRDRIRAVEGTAAALGARPAPNAGANYWFLRAKGKLGAFLRNANQTLRQARGDTDIDVMRRAIAHHRRPDRANAIRTIEALVAARPSDPFYQDLRGQIYLENRDFGRAVAAYGRAAELAPNNAQILAGYGRALLAAGNGSALGVLERAYARDRFDPRMLRDLAQAQAAAGQDGAAALTTAERLAVTGRIRDAGTLARRAAGLLPAGSAGARRAQDIAAASERAGG